MHLERLDAKMQIEINGRWLSKPMTGTGRYSAEVVKALLGAGHDVTLWVPSDAEVPVWARAARVRRMRSKGQWFEQVALPIRTAGRPLLSMGGPAPALKRRQLAVLHDATPFRLPQTYSWAFGTWYRLLYRMIGRSGAAIATVSQFSARELSSVLGVPVERLVLAEPAANSGPTGVRPDRALPTRFFLTVGTLAAHKNLVPVVSSLAQAGISVVTVGEEGSSQVFASSGLPDDASIVRLGRVSDEELQWLYAHAEALVFPSLYEGFGLPVLEAQLAGCPVIAANAGPLPEVLGRSALLIDPDTPDEFVVAARAMLDSPKQRAQLVAAGRDNVGRYSWDATATVLGDAVSRL